MDRISIISSRGSRDSFYSAREGPYTGSPLDAVGESPFFAPRPASERVRVKDAAIHEERYDDEDTNSAYEGIMVDYVHPLRSKPLPHPSEGDEEDHTISSIPLISSSSSSSDDPANDSISSISMDDLPHSDEEEDQIFSLPVSTRDSHFAGPANRDSEMILPGMGGAGIGMNGGTAGVDKAMQVHREIRAARSRSTAHKMALLSRTNSVERGGGSPSPGLHSSSPGIHSSSPGIHSSPSLPTTNFPGISAFPNDGLTPPPLSSPHATHFPASPSTSAPGPNLNTSARSANSNSSKPLPSSSSADRSISPDIHTMLSTTPRPRMRPRRSASEAGAFGGSPSGSGGSYGTGNGKTARWSTPSKSGYLSRNTSLASTNAGRWEGEDEGFLDEFGVIGGRGGEIGDDMGRGGDAYRDGLGGGDEEGGSGSDSDLDLRTPYS